MAAATKTTFRGVTEKTSSFRSRPRALQRVQNTRYFFQGIDDAWTRSHDRFGNEVHPTFLHRPQRLPPPGAYGTHSIQERRIRSWGEESSRSRRNNSSRFNRGHSPFKLSPTGIPPAVRMMSAIKVLATHRNQGTSTRHEEDFRVGRASAAFCTRLILACSPQPAFTASAPRPSTCPRFSMEDKVPVRILPSRRKGVFPAAQADRRFHADLPTAHPTPSPP